MRRARRARLPTPMTPCRVASCGCSQLCPFARLAGEPQSRCAAARSDRRCATFLPRQTGTHTVQQSRALWAWTLLMPPFGRSVSPGSPPAWPYLAAATAAAARRRAAAKNPPQRRRRAVRSAEAAGAGRQLWARAMREEDVTRDAPVVRGVNDRPRARPWLGQAAQAVSSTVAAGSKALLPSSFTHGRSSADDGGCSSMSGTGVVPPPLSLGGLNKNPMGWNGPAMSATGNANVDHQRDWLNQQLAEIGSGRSDASSIRPGSTRGSPRPTGGASASSSSMSGGLYPINGQEGGTGGAGGAGAAQPSGRPMQDAATSVQAGFRGMRSRRTAREQQQQRKPQRRRTPSPPRQARTPSPTFEEAEEEEVEAVAELPPLPPPPSQQPMPVRNPNLPPPPPSVLTPAERATTSYVMAGAAATPPLDAKGTGGGGLLFEKEEPLEGCLTRRLHPYRQLCLPPPGRARPITIIITALLVSIHALLLPLVPQ